jgi:hypothetical protein
MTEEQLLCHALRCANLAEACLDPVVANKLRALAQDYRRFAKKFPGRRTTDLDACPPLLAIAGERNQQEDAGPRE